MDLKILEELGLTKTEIKIYLALLKFGETTTTQIIRESEINPAKVYEFLDKLIKKGLVSYSIKSNKKYFIASSPESLGQILEERKEKISEQEDELAKLIPSLNSFVKEGEDKVRFEVYEGFKGIKSVYEKNLSLLNKGETHYIIGAPRIGNEIFEGYLLDWHKRRIKKGIKCKYIYDHDAKDYGKVREKMALTEVRYLPKEINSPMWIEIFGNHVGIGHIKKSNAVIFLIHDKEIAKGYLDYFNLIWKASSR